MYSYTVETASRTGISHEKHGLPNEDRAVVIEQDTRIWMGVFDGVSQGGGGGKAASIASECMESILKDSEGEDILMTGFNIMRQAQDSILAIGKQHPEYGRMRTTGVLACIDKSEKMLSWFSIGDSAAFICPKRKKAKKLTIEDTDIGEMLSQGKMSSKEAERATGGHELNRWLGMEGISPEVITHYVRFGQTCLKQKDSVLICTDGFYTRISPKMISKFLRKGASSEDLIKEARLLKSQDDITVALARTVKRAQHHLIPLGFCIAIVSFFFAAGVLLGVGLSDWSRRTKTNHEIILQEVGQHPVPMDTTSLKFDKHETD